MFTGLETGLVDLGDLRKEANAKQQSQNAQQSSGFLNNDQPGPQLFSTNADLDFFSPAGGQSQHYNMRGNQNMGLSGFGGNQFGTNAGNGFNNNSGYSVNSGFGNNNMGVNTGFGVGNTGFVGMNQGFGTNSNAGFGMQSADGFGQQKQQQQQGFNQNSGFGKNIFRRF